MKRIFDTIFVSFLLLPGWFLGLFKGEKAKTDWLEMMMALFDKSRFESHFRAKQALRNVFLDEFEVSAYHSS